MHCVSTVEITDVTLYINLRLYLLAASVFLDSIMSTLVDKQLATTQRIKMLVTSNMRTLCLSQPLSMKTEMYGTEVTDILHKTSIICPVG